MADDDAGGRVLGFPGLRIPGPVGEDPPPGGDVPSLSPLPVLAPPASLVVADNPDLSGSSETTTANPDSGMPDDSGSAGHGMAAMSTVMMAGIAVAAMRGAYHVATYVRARQEHHRAIADQQRAAAGKANLELEKARLGVEGARQRARIQSGPEFGRHARNLAGSGGRQNSARNNTPAVFRSGGPSRTSGGNTRQTPGKPFGGPSGGRNGAAGPRGRVSPAQARSRALENSPVRGRVGRTPGIAAAVRDRAANRVRNGPAPRPVKSPASPQTIRGAARGRIADRINTGSWKPTGPKPNGSNAAPSKPVSLTKSPATPQTIRGALRGRVADRITTGSWEPHKPKPGSPATIRGALRARAVDRITNGKKPKGSAPDSTTAGPKVDLTKKPKAKGGATGPGATASGASGAKARGGPQGTRGPGSGPGGPRKSRATRDRWERASARHSTRTSGPGASGAGPAGGRFGPPPGWGYTEGITITVERADGGPRPHGHRPPAGAITRGRSALPAGPAGTRTGAHVTVPVPPTAPNTQYADSDLTIYDVIDSDADMAEEITQGADDARLAAEGCEALITRLEALHSKVVELKVPGVLEGWVLLLVDKAMNVKARAEAVAEKIPAASEAIAQAGHNAEARHRPLADAVRDAGHAAPAERDYHNE